MTWITVLGIVLRLLEPALKVLGEALAKWLEDVLRASAVELAEGFDLYTHPGQVARLFDRARRRTWRWHLGKRAILRLAERAALQRRDAIFTAVKRGGFVPSLNGAERAGFAMYGPGELDPI